MKAATKTNLKLVSLVLGMFCFGFALVPIYDVFCEITGLNGKVSGPTITQYDENFDSREIKILFVTKNNENMAWNFTSERRTLDAETGTAYTCLLYTSPSPRDVHLSRMPSSA